MRRSGPRHIGWREFSFSRRSPLSVRMLTMRILATKETPTIMEFPRAFNEEPFPAFERRAARAARACEPGIVAGAERAPHNGWRERQPVWRGGRCLQKSFPMPKFQLCLPNGRGG